MKFVCKLVMECINLIICILIDVQKNFKKIKSMKYVNWFNNCPIKTRESQVA